jgi:hypothetical protein
MKIIASSIALTVVVGFSGIAMGTTLSNAHTQAQILPPPSVCAMLVQACLRGGGTPAECDKIYSECEP